MNKSFIEKCREGDLLVGTDEASNHYIFTRKNSVLIFLRQYQPESNDFYAFYVGQKDDDNLQQKIIDARETVSLIDISLGRVTFLSHDNCYDVSMVDDYKEFLFVPYQSKFDFNSNAHKPSFPIL